MPFLSIATISPHFISLSNLAPIISNAQVSDEIILALPRDPITNGLIPNGSLIPINFLLVNKPKLYAPLISYKASIIFFTIVFSLLLEIKWINASVSDVDWNIEPSPMSLFLNSIPLVKLPLCEQAKPPPCKSAKRGWMFLNKVLPVGEYRSWPSAA